MQKIINKHKCSGCHACFNICPQKSITMEQDFEGFLYPKFNQDSCIDCGLCKNVCPVLNEHTGNIGRAYACINKNDKVRMQSSSGGVFTIIAEAILDEGGVVFGAIFDDELSVVHSEIKSKAELDGLRGSKYLQSRIGKAYKKAKDYLDCGKKVLFSGTPCQISGLKMYLGKEYENLITQDIICHGVPSPTVWKKYLKYLTITERKNIDTKKKPEFRDKCKGWYDYSIAVFFENNEVFKQRIGDNLYMKAFLDGLCLRPSCYNCQSKSLKRESDITLADFWGIENVVPEMFDDKGTSLVLVNSSKGKRLFEAISDKMTYKEVSLDEAVQYNSSAYRSAVENKKRSEFFERIDKEAFDGLVNKLTKQPPVKRCLSKIKRIIRKVCRKNV